MPSFHGGAGAVNTRNQTMTMNAQTETHHTGGCLCGAVRFEVEGRFEHFFLCHCSRCRKGTGSAHAANLFSNNARLSWLAGEELVQSFTVEGTRFTRSFCPACGSALPNVAAAGRLKVPAGSLDTPVSLRPEAHIFTGSRANWDQHLEDVPSYDERPGG